MSPELRQIDRLPALPYFPALVELATHLGDCLGCQQPGTPDCPAGQDLTSALVTARAQQREAARWN